MTKLIPLKNRVIVKLEPYKDSEIIYHAGTYNFCAPNYGIVRFLNEEGKKLGLSVGDKVTVNQYTGAPFIEFLGEELKILKLNDVLGIIESAI